MNIIYIKPDLTIYFSAMPIIGLWLKKDYDKANSRTELLALMHKWFSVSDATTNETKAKCYDASAKYIYSLLTGKSYESR